MRDYAKVGPQFWIGPTGKQIKAAGVNATIVAMYLITSPHSNMLGLFYLPTLYLAHETGLGLEAASAGLKSCSEVGFCSYDPATEMVWVHEMASYQIASDLKESDRRCAGVQNDYDSLPENPFLGSFFDKYASSFHMTLRRGSEDKISPLEAPSKPHGSQEQEQEQEQDTPSSLRSDAFNSEKPKDELYRRAKERLGSSAGGMVTKLLAAHDGNVLATLERIRSMDSDATDDVHFRSMIGKAVASRKREESLNVFETGEAW